MLLELIFEQARSEACKRCSFPIPRAGIFKQAGGQLGYKDRREKKEASKEGMKQPTERGIELVERQKTRKELRKLPSKNTESIFKESI